MPAEDTLPDYAPMLSDYHRAHAPELRAMVASLPIREGDRVLELATGDGVYAHWLAERVGPSGSVTALDVSPAFLELARGKGDDRRLNFVEAAAEAMPFDDDTFDLVWCAQSLYSLHDPVESVRRMARVVRPGGVVAVLENDSLHHVLLPWPVEIELAVRAAELVGFAEESDRPRKYYVGRQLCEVFRQAGLTSCRRRTWATDRQAPLSPDEAGFLAKYLDDLRGRVRTRLDPKLAAQAEAILDPRSDSYLLNRPDFTVTCLDHVVCGTKPLT